MKIKQEIRNYITKRMETDFPYFIAKSLVENYEKENLEYALNFLLPDNFIIEFWERRYYVYYKKILVDWTSNKTELIDIIWDDILDEDIYRDWEI